MNIFNQFKIIINTIVLQPIEEARLNFLKIYSRNKRFGFFLAGIFIILSIALFQFSHWIFNTTNYSNNNFQYFQSENIQTPTLINNNNIQKESIGGMISDTESEQITEFLNNNIWVIFEDFIGNTPDPTGNSDCKSVNGECTLNYSNILAQQGKNEFNKVLFSKSTTQITSSIYFSNQLVEIVLPLFTLLCIIQGFNFISNDNHIKLKDFLKRFFISIGLFILTPLILSLTILSSNLLSKAILDGTSLSSSLSNFTVKLLVSLNALSSADSLWSGNILDFIFKTINPINAITSLFIIIPFIFLILLLVYICFQFVIRFLNLYFLAVVYPFVIVFAIHPKTNNIVNSYFKQWTTFIIQQPVFILSLKIIIDMIYGLNQNKDVLNVEYLIIFLGSLLFLASINLFTARLWGDVYTTMAQNITSAVGAGVTFGAIKSFIPSPGSKGFNLINLEKGALTGNTKIDLGGNSNPTNPGNINQTDDLLKKTNSLNPKDKRSSITKELDGAGFDINTNRDGTASVGGNFYTNQEDNSEMATLYTSREDATNDGLSREQIQEIHLHNLNVIDSSNGKAMKNYNLQINESAAASGNITKDIGICSNSLDLKVKKSMEIGKDINLGKNIQGIAIKNDLANGNRKNPIDNRIKIITYREVLNNNIDGFS